MCLPAIVFFIIFSYCPLPGVYIAFTNYNFRDGIFGSPFVGLKNFEFLAKSGQLWMLTRNTILYNLVFIVLGNVLQITMAILLNEIRCKWFKKVSQTIMFLPYFISAVLIGVIAFNILNYDTGALNTFLKAIGSDPVKVYSMPKAWPVIIVICQLWQQTGYGSIVYFASICGIDSSIMEAAEVDGATSWQRIRYISWPMIHNVVCTCAILAVTGALKVFDLPWVMFPNGAPLGKTWLTGTYMYYKTMQSPDIDYSSALALIIVILGVMLSKVVNRIFKERDY